MDGLGTIYAAEVALVGDGHPVHDRIEATLRHAFTMETLSLDAVLLGRQPLPPVAVFCLGQLGRPEAHRITQALARGSSRALFIFPSYRHVQVELAYQAGADDCLMLPIDDALLIGGVRRALNEAVEGAWAELPEAEAQALRASRESFDAVLAAASAGQPLPLTQVTEACEKIQTSLGVSNVNRWLGALRQHHDNTYRHCMFVCGVLAYFAKSLGIAGDDLRELTVGGFLHDAGKAKIPLHILDKPAKLDPDEWALMRTHPSHSREILLRENGLTARIVRMAVHHHEKLDGSGYPDGLRGAQIDDAVRLTAIADVYAALAETRAYKAAMPAAQALDVMAGFKDHLDPHLLRAFRSFILDQSGGGDMS